MSVREERLLKISEVLSGVVATLADGLLKHSDLSRISERIVDRNGVHIELSDASALLTYLEQRRSQISEIESFEDWMRFIEGGIASEERQLSETCRSMHSALSARHSADFCFVRTMQGRSATCEAERVSALELEGVENQEFPGRTCLQANSGIGSAVKCWLEGSRTPLPADSSHIARQRIFLISALHKDERRSHFLCAFHDVSLAKSTMLKWDVSACKIKGRAKVSRLVECKEDIECSTRNFDGLLSGRQSRLTFILSYIALSNDKREVSITSERPFNEDGNLSSGICKSSLGAIYGGDVLVKDTFCPWLPGSLGRDLVSSNVAMGPEANDSEQEFGLISPRRMADLFYGRDRVKKFASLSVYEIEAIATALRQFLKLDEMYCPDLLSIIEPLSNILDGLELRVGYGQLNVPEAWFDCYSNTITIEENVYQSLVKGDPRARMTLAHEVGHSALGHFGMKFRGLPGREIFPKKAHIEEKEANYFAREFLVPRKLVAQFETAEEISRIFGVSLAVAQIRLAEVKAHEHGKKTQVRKLPRSVIELLRITQRKAPYE